MTSLQTRLVTTTALVTAVVGFMSLPANAQNPEFIEGGAAVLNQTAYIDDRDASEKGKSPIADMDLDEILALADRKIRNSDKADQIEIVVAKPNPFLQPLVEVVDGKVKSTAVTKEVVNDLKDMNDLVYNMVKGYGLHQHRAHVVIERLQAEGWKWKVFNGLEGLNSDFGISAGMVFFHPEKKIAKVVIAGTASNDEGWEVNGESNLTTLTPENLQKAYFDDLMGEVEGMVKDALKPKAKALNKNTAVSQEVMNRLHDKIGVGINYLDAAGIREVGARLNRLAIENSEMSVEDLIQAAFVEGELEFKHHNLLTENSVETKTMRMIDLITTKDLNDSQRRTIAKVLAQEALDHRRLVELAKDKDYQAVLKGFLKDTIKHYKNVNHKSLKERLNGLFSKHKEEFESATRSVVEEKKPRGLAKFKTLLKKKKLERQPSFGPKTKEHTIAELVERNDDKSFGKAVLALGELKLLIREGKLAWDRELANRLMRVFELKIQVMSTVSNMEDKANVQGQANIGQGAVHLGFMKKSISMVGEVAGILKEAGVDKDWKTVVSGHSQGGGTGVQVLSLLDQHYGKELFGEDYDNTKTHNMSGYFFSAARAGDEDYAEDVNERLGKENIIRHNVHGDPVPIANGNKAFANWFKTLSPVVYAAVNKSMGYGDVGTLALQDGHETFLKAKEQYKAEGYDVSKFDTFDRALQFMAKGKLRSSVAAKTEKGFISEFLSYGGRSLTDIPAATKMASKFFKAFVSGNEEAQAELGEMLTKRYAHFHLGYDEAMKDGTLMGAHFNPNLILDTDLSLEVGQKHEESAEEY